MEAKANRFILAAVCLSALAATGGTDTVCVRTARESVTVDTKGARVLSYVLDGCERLADPRAPTMARWPGHGGIPLCWPWFGSGGPDPKVKHGFVHRLPFRVTRSSESPTRAELVLAARSDAGIGGFPGHLADLELTIVLEGSLALKLTTFNRGTEEFRYTAGFHPYFAVTDPAAATVDGLDGLAFCNTLTRSDHRFAEIWKGPFRFTAPYDHVFAERGPGLRHAIADRAGGRTILVESPEATRTVVWFEPDGRKFVCVEPVICWREGEVAIPPGRSHTLSMRVSFSTCGEKAGL